MPSLVRPSAADRDFAHLSVVKYVSKAKQKKEKDICIRDVPLDPRWIPADVAFLNLERLSLVNVALSYVPDVVFQLQTLDHLAITGTDITSITSIGSLNRLKSLILHSNKIDWLPDDFGSLWELEELDLHQNRLTNRGIAPELYGFTKLRCLDLSSNKLINVPLEMAKLGVKIREIHLHDNPWNKPELAALTATSTAHETRAALAAVYKGLEIPASLDPLNVPADAHASHEGAGEAEETGRLKKPGLFGRKISSGASPSAKSPADAKHDLAVSSDDLAAKRKVSKTESRKKASTPTKAAAASDPPPADVDLASVERTASPLPKVSRAVGPRGRKPPTKEFIEKSAAEESISPIKPAGELAAQEASKEEQPAGGDAASHADASSSSRLKSAPKGGFNYFGKDASASVPVPLPPKPQSKPKIPDTDEAPAPVPLPPKPQREAAANLVASSEVLGGKAESAPVPPKKPTKPTPGGASGSTAAAPPIISASPASLGSPSPSLMCLTQQAAAGQPDGPPPPVKMSTKPQKGASLSGTPVASTAPLAGPRGSDSAASSPDSCDLADPAAASTSAPMGQKLPRNPSGDSPAPRIDMGELRAKMRPPDISAPKLAPRAQQSSEAGAAEPSPTPSTSDANQGDTKRKHLRETSITIDKRKLSHHELPPAPRMPGSDSASTSQAPSPTSTTLPEMREEPSDPPSKPPADKSGSGAIGAAAAAAPMLNKTRDAPGSVSASPSMRAANSVRRGKLSGFGSNNELASDPSESPLPLAKPIARSAISRSIDQLADDGTQAEKGSSTPPSGLRTFGAGSRSLDILSQPEASGSAAPGTPPRPAPKPTRAPPSQLPSGLASTAVPQQPGIEPGTESSSGFSGASSQASQARMALLARLSQDELRDKQQLGSAVAPSPSAPSYRAKPGEPKSAAFAAASAAAATAIASGAAGPTPASLPPKPPKPRTGSANAKQEEESATPIPPWKRQQAAS
ncbi:hypothetical protein HK105_201168 [Polyrhizophydium stewartii]|uniref:Uncharacterized protein n=1 Tax=Polyrhizophydium stewartii TaxID=2732419 RepID=A0ABR4NJ10_9FUNG